VDGFSHKAYHKQFAGYSATAKPLVHFRGAETAPLSLELCIVCLLDWKSSQQFSDTWIHGCTEGGKRTGGRVGEGGKE